MLDEKNQSGLGGKPKWDPKSRSGFYLGLSPIHDSSVALVLNQCGLVFDEELSTVSHLHSNNI